MSVREGMYVLRSAIVLPMRLIDCSASVFCVQFCFVASSGHCPSPLLDQVMGESFAKHCSGISPNQAVGLTCCDNGTSSRLWQMAWKADAVRCIWGGCQHCSEMQGFPGSPRPLSPRREEAKWQRPTKGLNRSLFKCIVQGNSFANSLQDKR